MKKEILDNNKKIIELYKQAWENHDTNLLSEIFSDDIIYEEKPNNSIIGIKKLIEYWEENKKKQYEVTFNLHRIKYFENEIILEWRAKFYHLVKKCEIMLKGIMWLEIKNNKITHLTEYFNIY